MKLGSVIVGTGLSENAYLVVEAAADLAQGRGRRCTLFVPATGYRTHQIRDTFAELPGEFHQTYDPVAEPRVWWTSWSRSSTAGACPTRVTSFQSTPSASSSKSPTRGRR